MKKFTFLFLLGIISNAEAAPTVNITASPNNGFNTVYPTLTWSTTGAVSCTASSSPVDAGWNGSVPISGTKTVGPIKISTYYYLTCLSGSDYTASLDWVAPTINSDGSPLTDLAGFKIYEVQTSPQLLLTVGYLITSAYFTGLPVGTHTYYVTSYNTSSVESDPSNTALKTTYNASSASSNAYVNVKTNNGRKRR